MKNNNIFKASAVAALFTLTFTFSGCGGDDDKPQVQPIPVFNGTHESIEAYVTPELLETMEGLGLQINEGSTPPAVSGEFLDSVNVLQASNIAGSVPGSVFADTYFKFEHQNLLANTIDVSYYTPGNVETSSGIGTVISGHGEYFSVIAKQKTVHASGTADGVIIVSGRLTQAGIEDFQFAIFMLDNHGDTSFIANKKGRLFRDQDNVASKQ
jgi:hypothetical protein